ncbi:diguanylate cyclase [Hyphomonas sp. WL0036]|uniref:GGDEF domain-containing protein n=1 Tax=Hyphomonas sediminis TaxID=2866160 RepID=UPI001C817E30|nr:diguanylate cyclase [Hyphomonas sediminis]MBY9065268.1 diguanylate cyclase [Hyphomonas sediminis]
MSLNVAEAKTAAPSPEARGGQEFRDACKAAISVFQLSEKYKTAPYPHAYAVWFAYTTKADPELVAEIDELLLTKDTLTGYDIDLLFQAYLIEDTGVFATHDIGQAIGDEIHEVLGVISESLEQTSSFNNRLAHFEQDIPQALSAEKLSAVVTNLIEENRRMAAITDQLSQGLSRSQEMISTLNQQLNEVRNQSLCDALTGVLNRRAFDRALDEAVERAGRLHQPLCVAMADLDHFKTLNDTHGHLSGDAVLQAFAGVLSGDIEHPEAVARYGGEEFALILPECDLMTAYNRLVSMKHKFSKMTHLSGDGNQVIPPVTASFGLARLEPGMSARDLMQKADAYLYEAKSKGRNTVKAQGIG